MTILRAEEKDFPASHWTLARMDLPRGTVINDYYKAERLGYWDGEKISKGFVPREQKPSMKTQWTFILLLAALIAVVVWIGILKNKRNNLPRQSLKRSFRQKPFEANNKKPSHRAICQQSKGLSGQTVPAVSICSLPSGFVCVHFSADGRRQVVECVE